jgi:hypothetical protein
MGIEVDAGDGSGVVLAGAQEAVKRINNTVARMRARCVIERFSHTFGIRTRGSLILENEKGKLRFDF